MNELCKIPYIGCSVRLSAAAGTVYAGTCKAVEKVVGNLANNLSSCEYNNVILSLGLDLRIRL